MSNLSVGNNFNLDTTQKHKNDLIQAASHLTVLLVPYPSVNDHSDHVENLNYLSDLIIDDFNTLINCRSWAQGHKNNLRRSVRAYNCYLSNFKVKGFKPIVLTDEFEEMMRELVDYKSHFQAINDAKRSKREEEKREKARLEREEKERQRVPKDIVRMKNWKKGEFDYFYGRNVLKACFLRVKGDEVETSKGARVPLDRALWLYGKILDGNTVNGLRIGHYTVTCLNDSKLEIGCHTIEMKEVHRTLGELYKLSKFENEFLR